MEGEQGNGELFVDVDGPRVEDTRDDAIRAVSLEEQREGKLELVRGVGEFGGVGVRECGEVLAALGDPSFRAGEAEREELDRVEEGSAAGMNDVDGGLDEGDVGGGGDDGGFDSSARKDAGQANHILEFIKKHIYFSEYTFIYRLSHLDQLKSKISLLHGGLIFRTVTYVFSKAFDRAVFKVGHKRNNHKRRCPSK